MAGSTRPHTGAAAQTMQTASAPPVPLLVLGVGSPLMGDDALGILAIQQLQARADIPSHVTLIDGGTDGLGLVPILAEYPRAILIDAVHMGQPPGTLRRFTWDEARLQGTERALSLHQSGLGDALLLAETLGCLPTPTLIFGVQPLNTDWDDPLSPAVERALPTLIDALLNEIRSETHA